MLFFSEIDIRAGEANLRAKLPAKFVSYVVKADSGFGMTPPCSQCPLLAQKSLIQRPNLSTHERPEIGMDSTGATPM